MCLDHESLNNNDIIILSSNELPCYSCLDSSKKTSECLCEGAKCAIKSKDSNTTEGSKNKKMMLLGFKKNKKKRFIFITMHSSAQFIFSCCRNIFKPSLFNI